MHLTKFFWISVHMMVSIYVSICVPLIQVNSHAMSCLHWSGNARHDRSTVNCAWKFKPNRSSSRHVEGEASCCGGTQAVVRKFWGCFLMINLKVWCCEHYIRFFWYISWENSIFVCSMDVAASSSSESDSFLPGLSGGVNDVWCNMSKVFLSHKLVLSWQRLIKNDKDW